MDGAQFAKMLSDKHLFELNRMEYKYSTVSVKEFAELLRQNFAQPLPLTDFSGNKLFYLPNLAQISTNGMKQLLSVPVSGQNFGLSAMTEEIYATFQIESIRSTRSSIRYILDGYAPRDEQEARIYGMKRGLEFIANRQNRITEENLHHLYQISTGDYLPDEDRLLPNHFYRHGEVFIVGGEEPRPGLPAERLPGAMKCLVDFANANDGINELHKAAILHFAFAYYHPYFDGNGRTARLFHLWYLVQQGYPAALFTPFLTNYTIKRRFLQGIFEIRFWFEWFHIIPFYQPDFLQPSQGIPSLGNHALQRVPLEHLYNIYQLQLMYYQFHLEQ